MTLAELVYSLLDVKEASKDGEVWLKCPFCGDEKFRFGVNLNDGRAHCFRGSCEWKTRDKKYLFTELCRVLGIEEEYTEEQTIKIKKKKKDQKIKEISLPEEYEPLWSGINEDVGERALAYVKNRGITLSQIKHHKLGFCAVGKYAWRVIFPVMFEKKIVGLTGRDFSGRSSIKYLNSESTKIFYNIASQPGEFSVLSEGPVDALAIERATEDLDCNSLGRLGTGLTGPNIKILKQYKENVFWPDPDLAGIDLCIKACKEISRYTKVSVVIPEGETDVDPGKLGEKASGLAEIVKRLSKRKEWSSDVALKLRLKVGSL